MSGGTFWTVTKPYSASSISSCSSYDASEFPVNESEALRYQALTPAEIQEEITMGTELEDGGTRQMSGLIIPPKMHVSIRTHSLLLSVCLFFLSLFFFFYSVLYFFNFLLSFFGPNLCGHPNFGFIDIKWNADYHLVVIISQHMIHITI